MTINETFRNIAVMIEHNHKRELFKTNLKQTLESKILSKKDYLVNLKNNWEDVIREGNRA